MTSNVLASSVASLYGRNKGIFAPYVLDISAISLESVDTITSSNMPLSMALSIV